MAEQWERCYVVRSTAQGGWVFTVDGNELDRPNWIVPLDKELGSDGWKLISVRSTDYQGANAVEHIYQRKVS